MFPRRERISRASFAEALKGRREHSPHFTLLFPHNTRGYAVVVPKKAVRLSVDRHSLKRRIMAALRSLALPPALIVMVKGDVAGLTYGELRTELEHVLSDRK